MCVTWPWSDSHDVSRRSEAMYVRQGRNTQIISSGAAIFLGLNAPEQKIPDAVPQAQASLLKLGERPPLRPWGMAFRRVGQPRFGRQNLQHLNGIVFPVGGAVKIAAGRQLLCEQVNQVGLDQAPLVVPFLR